MENKRLGGSFIEKRDEDLHRVYDELRSRGVYSSNDELLEMVVNSPTKRFWVTVERVLDIVRLKRKGTLNLNHFTQTRRAMYTEIINRFEEIERENQTMHDMDKAIEVIYQPAPSFYITPQSAKVILCRSRKKKDKSKTDVLKP